MDLRIQHYLLFWEESMINRRYSKSLAGLASGLLVLFLLVSPVLAAADESMPVSEKPSGSTIPGKAPFLSAQEAPSGAPAVCPGSIGFGETIQCSISAAGEIDSYSFNASAGDKILVRMGISSGTFTPDLQLFDPGGTKLCDGSNPTLFSAEIATCTLSSTGTHTILAYDHDGISTGDYYLYLQRLNDPGSPVAISLGQTLSGSIPTPAEMDTYTFTGIAGDKVLVRMGNSSGILDPELRLYGPDGTKLCEALNAASAYSIEIASCTLTSTGTQAILAYDHNGFKTYTGDYSLVLQRLNNPSSPATISFGQTLSGTINPAAKMDSYTFTATAGDKVLVRMGNSSGIISPELRLYGPDGTKLCETLNTTSAYSIEIPSCTLTSTGIHTFLAFGHEGFRSYTGDYSVALQRLNNSGSPATISYGQTLSGTINPAAKMDSYTFAATAGDKVLVRMGMASGSLSPALRLYGPDGTKLCEALNATSAYSIEIATCAITSTGIHTIMAYGHDGFRSYTGGYAVVLQRLNNPGSPATISNGQTLSGAINPAAKMDSYTFTANAGDRVLVRMSRTSGILSPELRLYGPDGTKLCEALNATSALMVEISSCILTSTGIHTILAYDHNGYSSYTGNYSIYLAKTYWIFLPLVIR
jgi:hypothetical protein